MLANDMAAESRRLHEANPKIRYQIFDDGGHPLIATRAEEIAEAAKKFLMGNDPGLYGTSADVCG